MNELRELFRYANIALAITIPILVVGAFLLRDAPEGVQGGFGLFIFVFGLVLLHVVEAYAKHRRKHDQ